MNIDQLREFVDLTKTCSFQESSENMNISQPSLSKHINKLETELGVQLFSRVSRGIKLNDFGKSFAVYASKIVELSNAAIGELNNMKTSGNNSLCVCFHPILGQYGLVQLISSFTKKYPDIALSLIESNTPEEMLKTFQCDLVFAPEDELASPDIRRILYMRDNLAVIFPEDHPLAKEDAVTLSQLQDEAFIVHCGTNTDSQMESINLFKICKEKGFSPNVLTTVSRTSIAAEFVRQGKGIALLFRRHVPIDITGIKIVDIIPEIPVNICVFYLKKRMLPNSVNTFLEYVRSYQTPQAE